MTRGVDFSGLSPAERAVAIGGATLFVDGFVPWWYRIQTPAGTYLHNAGLTGWGLAAVLAGFVTALLAIARAVRRTRRNTRDYVAYIVLGAAALGALAVQGRRPPGEWIGYWIAVGAGLAIVVAGLRRLAERRSGWI